MASLSFGPDDLLVASCCLGDSLERSANFVPVRVKLSKNHHTVGGAVGSPSSEKEEFGAERRVWSRGAGVARESKFRVGCSETQTQTVVSAQATEESKIVCEVCRGLGFFICDYCEGEKVNVPVKNRINRFHRRCPTCRAVGVLMCTRCKVFKCVTFPDEDDGSLEKKR